MSLERISLFSSKKEFLIFTLVCGFIFTYSLLIEYNNYKNLTQFDSSLVHVSVLKQYQKTKITKKGKLKYYQVLKLKSDKGFNFYTTKKKNFPYSKGKRLELEIWAGKINFYQYMTSFFAYSKVLSSDMNASVKQNINTYISSTHENDNIADIYKALYTATSLPKNLQEKFSILGISHLLAISGFHLGVLSTLLFFLFRTPYKLLQNRYFPFRSYKVDSFLIISIVLFIYLLFLDTPPSLLRAFTMLIIGFILYDRGFKILTMMTLLLTIILIISFAPRLFFSIGFWLSVSGVFYIFLFLIHFKDLNKVLQFILVPIWVYIMMLPISLFIFQSFSYYHPLSILLTSLFSLFYPLSIFLHLISFGNVLDDYLLWILNLDIIKSSVTLSKEIMLTFVLISLLSIWKKGFVYVLISLAFLIFINAIYHVT